jgi:hypothetical protein
MVNPFSYSPTIINALERALSPERLSTYLAAANGDHAAALRLYVWNTEISAALYGPLHIAGPRNSCPQRFSPRAVRRLRPHLVRQSAGPTDAPCPGSRRGRQGYLAPRQPSARSRTHRGRALVRILGTAPYSRASRQAQLRDGPLAPCPSSRLSQLASPARRCTQAPARTP